MQSLVNDKIARPAEALLKPVSQNRVPLASPRTEACRQWVARLTLAFSDVVLALVIWEIACLGKILVSSQSLSGIMIASIIPVTLVWVGLRATQGLYPGYGMDEVEELKRQTYALVATLAFAAIFALAFQIGDALSRSLLALVFAGLLILSPLARHFVKRWLNRHGVWGKPVVIVGMGDAGTRVETLLTQEWSLGLRPVALFDSRAESKELAEVKEGSEGRPDENILAGAVELSRNHKVDTLFLAMPHAPREYLSKLADLASIHFRSVVIIPDLAGVTSSVVVARNLAGTLGVEVRHNLLDPWVRRFKRGLDLIGVLVGGLLISPALVALAVLIRLDSSGPAFFSHRRLGAGDEHFDCWKFRTMHADAERLLEEHLENNPHLRVEWEQNHKLKDDPRVTRVGHFLRKTSLDELPQLWNVLRAEMSLVGPRPIVDEEIVKYGESYALYSRTKPGMSGFWQVSGRSDTSYDSRVGMDAYYVRNWSVWLDLVILARTVRSVLAGQGAC